MSEDYIFDTGTDLGRLHMSYNENMLDNATMWWLDAAAPAPGATCMDIGAGGGSVVKWMAERAGSTGKVVAVDLDTKYVPRLPGVEVHTHDINEGLPDDGPYDLIHARLFLMHLPQREAIFKSLVEALKPGGWLVLGDMSTRLLKAMAVPTEADRELWDRVQHISHHVVGRGRGIRWEWAHEADAAMVAAGLTNVDAMEYSRTSSGGGDACQLHRNLNIQAEPLLLQAGLTEDELSRYRELMLNPDFRAWYYQFVYTRGQKPA